MSDTVYCGKCGTELEATEDGVSDCLSCLYDDLMDQAAWFNAPGDDAADLARTYSPRVEDGAIRLFTNGYFTTLAPVDGFPRTRWTIQSETEPGTRYLLERDPASNRISCSCPGGTYCRSCKHMRFLEYALGLSNL
jgi:hypothetical protein